MASDTLSANAAHARPNRFDRDTVGMNLGSRELGRIYSKLEHRFAGNRIRCLSAIPGKDLASLDGTAYEPSVKAALLGIAEREVRIGGEEEIGRSMTGKIMMHVGHPALLVAPKKRSECIARRNALMQQKCARIERQDRWALVIDHAAAEKPSLADRHLERIGSPSGTRRNNVDMGDRCNLTRLAAGDVAPANIAFVLVGRIAQPTRDIKRAIKGIAHRAAERCPRRGLAGIRNRGIPNERGDVGNQLVPNLLDIRIDMFLKFYAVDIAHRYSSSQAPPGRTP